MRPLKTSLLTDSRQTVGLKNFAPKKYDITTGGSSPPHEVKQHQKAPPKWVPDLETIHEDPDLTPDGLSFPKVKVEAKTEKHSGLSSLFKK